MPFATPLALLALLAVPAVVALHLFRRRYRPRTVAGLFLFAPDARVAAAGRKRARLIRSASLWLELAAAAVLALWLAGPRLFDFGAPPHLVVVLDDSASMGARGADGASFAARARAKVEARLRELGRDARVTLIATGPRPRLLVGPKAPAAVVAGGMGAWEPMRPRHDQEPALDLGRELGGADAELWFVTDTPPGAPVRGFHVHAVGQPRPNAALVHARRVAGDGGDKLYVDATAHAAAPLATTLRVVETTTGRALGERRAALEPARLTRFELDLPASTDAVEVRLEPDALAIDDVLTLLPEPRPKVVVAVRVAADIAQALQLQAALRALGDRVEVGSGAVADLEITTAATDGSAGVQLVVAPGAEPVEAFLGPFLFERRHPLLRGLTFEGVIWSAGSVPDSGRPLVFTGERALVAEDVVGDRVRYTLALAPGRSNLPTSPDWPILLSNLVDLARERLPGPLRVNLRTGELIEWRRAPREDSRAPLELIDPAGGTYPGHGLRVVTFEPWRVGIHRLLRAGVEVGRYAVAFVDPHESDLARAGTAEMAPPAAASVTVATESGAFELRALALLLLALVLADWFVLAPTRAAGEAA